MWSLIGMLILLVEGYTVGTPQPGDTLSETIRDAVRFDTIGRFILLPLWCWLSWHWLLRPQRMLGESWIDILAVLIGVGWAVAETLLRRG